MPDLPGRQPRLRQVGRDQPGYGRGQQASLHPPEVDTAEVEVLQPDTRGRPEAAPEDGRQLAGRQARLQQVDPVEGGHGPADQQGRQADKVDARQVQLPDHHRLVTGG